MLFTLSYVLLVAGMIAIASATEQLGGWRWMITAPILGWIGYRTLRFMRGHGGPGPSQASQQPQSRIARWSSRFFIKHPFVAMGVLIIFFVVYAIFFGRRGLVPSANV